MYTCRLPGAHSDLPCDTGKFLFQNILHMSTILYSIKKKGGIHTFTSKLQLIHVLKTVNENTQT